MQRNYGRNQIPDLRKKSRSILYLEEYFIDPTSCFIIFAIAIILIGSIMFVAGTPNSNMPINM
ncbi:MAG: hypothetical protein PHY59_03160 [Methanobacterium sp.]|nr:hypothetical protein [Methanobacterium sp.]